jgi:hypothetical protein
LLLQHFNENDRNSVTNLSRDANFLSTDPGGGQGSATGEAGALRASLTLAGSVRMLGMASVRQDLPSPA